VSSEDVIGLRKAPAMSETA